MLDLVLTSNYDEVVASLQMDKTYNKPLKTINNFVNILEVDNSLKSLIRFNEISNSPENARKGIPWQESDDSVLKCYIEKNYQIRSEECYQNAFNIICNKYRYNPLKEIIEMQTWDGKNRINTILQKYLKCDDDEYTKEVARLLFTGGIARLYQPGIKFDCMVIFRGKQGCGKSSFARWLAINDSYFNEITTIEGQEGKESMEGAWICEISELLALSKTKEVEAVKSFITRQNDNYRKPYERRVTDNPRKCIFIGTTNKTQFLTDKTGNRRFLPIEVKSDGVELYKKEQEVRAEILQCWAEAKHYYDKKEYTLSPDINITKMIEEKQNDVVEDDWRIGMIEEYLQTHSSVCVKELWDKALNMELKDCTKKDSNEIVSIMENFKEYNKVMSMRCGDYGRQRGWKRDLTKNEDIKLEEIDDEKLPF